MNELLQKHGCSNVFTVPEGLKELMSDITREVLRSQPRQLLDFIANYLSALLITREHGIMAVKILDDLCDCRPSVSEHLLQLGFEREKASQLAELIKNDIEQAEPVEGKETIREYRILQNLLKAVPMDEETSALVCQVMRNAYRDYWYRRNLLKQGMMAKDQEPWQIAAQHTLELYKKTKPSFSELNRATERIQAAYKGYHVRKNVLTHLVTKKSKKQGRKVDLSGPPIDVAGAREIDLGPVINIRNVVVEENVNQMFQDEASAVLGLPYDPMKTITHEEDFLKVHSPKVKVPGEKPVQKGRFADETRMVAMTLIADESEDMEEKEDSPEKSPSQHSARASGRISFAEVPPEIITVVEEEPVLDFFEEQPAPGLQELKEVVHEIEDIPEDIEDEDGDDITDSAGLSAPETEAGSGRSELSDIEDIAEAEEET